MKERNRKRRRNRDRDRQRNKQTDRHTDKKNRAQRKLSGTYKEKLCLFLPTMGVNSFRVWIKINTPKNDLGKAFINNNYSSCT